VLVLVTPGDGGKQRCEVLTAAEVDEDERMVAWLHGGSPSMCPHKVLIWHGLCRVFVWGDLV